MEATGRRGARGAAFDFGGAVFGFNFFLIGATGGTKGKGSPMGRKGDDSGATGMTFSVADLSNFFGSPNMPEGVSGTNLTDGGRTGIFLNGRGIFEGLL